MNLLHLTYEDAQKVLKRAGFYSARIDGDFGGKSNRAVSNALQHHGQLHQGDGRDWVRAVQAIVGATVDGWAGPSTEAHVERYLDAEQWRVGDDVRPSDTTPPNAIVWPRYVDATRFYGEPGNGWKSFKIPYPMSWSWVPGSQITSLVFHEKCGASAVGILEAVLDEYGHDGIHELGLNICGGTGNVRPIRGGQRWSTHSWASAIDFDPERNQLRWNATQARLAQSDAVPFWRLWEAEGWVSLGRTRDFDWMHIQAMR